jgi:hypothetical protein
MRTLSQLETNLLKKQARSVFLRVRIKDSTGTYQDYSTLRGRNWVVSASVSTSVDESVGKASVVLKRDQFALALPPLMTGSVFNIAGANYLELGREALIEIGQVPHGQPVSAVTSWRILYHGYVDKLDWSGVNIQVDLRDRAALIQDTYIETQRAYGRWLAPTFASRKVLLGTVVVPSSASVPPNAAAGDAGWRCTVAGTTGGTEPVWTGTTVTDGGVTWVKQTATPRAPSTAYALGAIVSGVNPLQYWTCTTAGTSSVLATNLVLISGPTTGLTVNDGTAVWTYTAGLYGTPIEVLIQSLLNDNMTTPPTLVYGTASGWYANQYLQQTESLWTAIQSLATQLGYDLRYEYDSGAGDFTLQLLPVLRASSAVAWTHGPGLYCDTSQVNRDITTIRNAIQVVYPNWEANDPTGGPPGSATAAPPVMTPVTVTDATSITKYGRRFAQISEASSSGVNTNALASQLANAVLSDLKEPQLDLEASVPFFFPVQVNDRDTFSADGRHFDTDQTLAVVGFQHTLSMTSQRTVLHLRGTPTAGSINKWAGISAGPGVAPSARTQGPSTPAQVQVNATIAGVSVIHNFPMGSMQVPGSSAELHLSTTSGFTPSSSTLAARTVTNRFDLAGLIQGTTYYVRMAYRDSRGNLSGYTVEQSLTPSFVASSHLAPFLRSSARMEVSSGYAYPGDDLALTFNTTAIWDTPGGWASSGGTTYAVQTSGKYRIRASLLVSGASIVAGDTLQLYVQRITSGPVTTKILGTMANAVLDHSTTVRVMNADLDQAMDLKSGDTLKIYSRFLGAAGTKNVVATNVTTGSPSSGTFWEISPVVT